MVAVRRPFIPAPTPTPSPPLPPTSAPTPPSPSPRNNAILGPHIFPSRMNPMPSLNSPRSISPASSNSDVLASQPYPRPRFSPVRPQMSKSFTTSIGAPGPLTPVRRWTGPLDKAVAASARRLTNARNKLSASAGTSNQNLSALTHATPAGTHGVANRVFIDLTAPPVIDLTAPPAFIDLTARCLRSLKC